MTWHRPAVAAVLVMAAAAGITAAAAAIAPDAATPPPTEIVLIDADGLALPAVEEATTTSSIPDEPIAEATTTTPPSGGFAPTPDVDVQQADGDGDGDDIDRQSGVHCSERTADAPQLERAFGRGVDDIVGADYQRAVELDDGRVLWAFQDVFVETSSGSEQLVHNGVAIQDGMCFERLTSPSEGRPTELIRNDESRRLDRWFWPLGGFQRDDDSFELYLAEMDEQGASYLDNAVPVATWVVSIDLTTLTVSELRPAPDPTADLYGFEVVTDDEFVYLYAQCHRQFGFSELGHDPCAAEVRVARQPIDRPDDPLEYWTGDTWSPDADLAANIAPQTGPSGEQRLANPMQIERDGDRWIAVTKAGDWWGTEVYFDVADQPEGPWTTTAVLPVGGQDEFFDITSYFVSFIPTGDDADPVVSISANRWDGAFSDSYRPWFATVPSEVWNKGELTQLIDNTWISIA